MDLDTYETVTMQIPADLDLSADDNIEFLEFEDKRKILQ
jgi:translation initiation factor 5A